MKKEVKKRLNKKEFYTPILNLLKTTTNLTKISKQLSISKQNLNYYLRNLNKKGYIIKKDKGWWELTEKSKNSTKYGGEFLPKDFIRGHAYIWTIKLAKEIEGWDKRIEILSKKGINYNLVGILKDIPRIKVLGRKVWLCKNHLRIFDNKNASYYGENSIEARNRALNELFLIVGALERKLGVFLKPLELEWAKEHYALIKNDLAIDQNRKGIIWRISDELGEWLLIDDSLEEGGELENVGKKSFQVNPKMQKWWNENKKTNFEVTPTFVLNVMNGIQQNQLIFDKNMQSHIEAIQNLSKGVKKLTRVMKGILTENRDLKLKSKHQKKLGDFIK